MTRTMKQSSCYTTLIHNESAQTLYSHSLLTYFMNQINNKILMGLIAVLGVSLLIAGTNSVYGYEQVMNEDQIEICNYEYVCQLVNADDVMNRPATDKLLSSFDNNVDTYLKIDALDEECKQNYHVFCFGEAWNSLKEMYTQ